MVSACGLVDDADDPMRDEPRDQRAAAFGVVGEAARLGGGVETGVAVIFADVDTSVERCRVGCAGRPARSRWCKSITMKE